MTDNSLYEELCKIREQYLCRDCTRRFTDCPNLKKEDKMRELDKLQAYLEEHGFYYKRLDEEEGGSSINRHQIIVYETAECTEKCRLWDAICQYGSYGYKDGLLETMGVIVDEDKCGDTVEGYLTADDVIERIKAWEKRKEAEAVRYGWWQVNKTNGYKDMTCLSCGWLFEYYDGLEEEWNYCPHCGKHMREVEE